ncbi:MAG: DUF2125 domain-containing protein, partial [Acetobacteraceae bacterium]|nr:DUF2125 domain-containing protein [Acetobacteraceae bacterium]
MRGRSWLVLVALIVLVIAGHWLYWRSVERHLAVGFEVWAAELRTEGWAVTAGPLARGGWPLAATLALPQLSLEGGESDIPGGFSWGAEHVVLRVALLRPAALSITAEGRQHVRVGELPDLPYTAEGLEAAVPLGPIAAPHPADLLARNVRAAIPSGLDRTASLTVGFLRAHFEARPSAT